MAEPNVDLRPCPHAPRCTRQVFPVKIMKGRGFLHELLDATPVSWEDGARIKLIVSEHLPRGQQLAEKLTASQAWRAFGVKAFYVPHAEVCEAAQRRTATSRKKSGHA